MRYDLHLIDAWGGALICPQTDIARDWCAATFTLGGDDEFWPGPSWPAFETEDGDYRVGKRDACDIASCARQAGLTFANSQFV